MSVAEEIRMIVELEHAMGEVMEIACGAYCEGRSKDERKACEAARILGDVINRLKGQKENDDGR